ncbi:MAG: NifU family protein [Alphaproteobacteria bacterium]|jgi:Fe-S cluster biogenesis protein NfuA
MRIETQLAADNNIMHFFAESGFPVKGSVEFSDAKSLRRSPLAENIFDLGGVTSVVITPDCLSVTKEEGALWDDLKPQVLAEIMDFLSRGEAPVREGEETAEDVVHNIVGLLNARIRPAIRKDGGDIVFRGFENGIVYVELQGKCVGCPYSQRTLKDGVEKLLRTYIKEVIAVEKYES